MERFYCLFIAVFTVLILEGCKVQSEMSSENDGTTDIHVWSANLKTIYVAVPDTYKEILYKLYTDANGTSVEKRLTAFVEKKDKGINIFTIENSLELTKLDVSIGEGTSRKVRKLEFSKENISSSADYKCYRADQEICEIEAVIFRETNAYRKRVRLKEFQVSLSVSYVARDWSVKQARNGGISHKGFSGSRMVVLNTLKSDSSLDANQIRGLFNENVAMVPWSKNPEDIGKDFTNMWLTSPGHLANIQASNTYLGVGVAKSGGGYYATQIFAQ